MMKTRLTRLRATFAKMPKRYGFIAVPVIVLTAWEQLLDLLDEIIKTVEDNETRRNGDKKK